MLFSFGNVASNSGKEYLFNGRTNEKTKLAHRYNL
jgi:hypothetical protein